ncbi:transcriptional regulator TbsP domain-containing protein [Halorubrum sp. FL23]|uniref:transcriptional regulator TbsP domain-containing protein n=1 Tax=Halorubrum sp. FL23 TaxID=3458704 RepID=UPI004033CC33
MARSTGDDGASSLDSDDPSEVAVALNEADDGLAEAIESALAGRSDLVAVGVPLALLPPILDARERTEADAPWRVACRPGVADALGRALVLGTAVAEAIDGGAIELRTEAEPRARAAESDAGRILFASAERVDAVAGPEGDRTLVTEAAPARVAPAARSMRERFAAAAPASVEMPGRSRLLAGARETLDDRFADDVAAVLDALPYGAVGRTGELTDRTLLTALAARHDHLLWDLRRWIGTGTEPDDGSGEGEGVGIAAGQDLTGDRRVLVQRGLIEAIKVPAGAGRPRLRLRAIDDALLRATPEEVLSVLRGRFALPVDEDGRVRDLPGGDERRPVWDRPRRDKN